MSNAKNEGNTTLRAVNSSSYEGRRHAACWPQTDLAHTEPAGVEKSSTKDSATQQFNVILKNRSLTFLLLGDKGNALEAEGNALRTKDMGVRTGHKDVPVDGWTTVRRARVRATE